MIPGAFANLPTATVMIRKAIEWNKVSTTTKKKT